MSGVLSWLKSNILIVVFGVLILILPPAGFVGSSIWNGKIKAAAEETLSSKKRAIDGASKVTYTLPPIEQGEQPVTESRPPNAAITAYYEQKRAERQAMIEEVVTRAVRFNKKENREVLVPGLFPAASDDREERRLAKQMAELIVGTEGRPSVYEGLFRGINAGEPLEAADVARRVVDAYRSEIDRSGGNVNAMTAEEKAALDERMKGQRLGVYARRAEEISVYGSVAALRGANPATDSVILEEVPGGLLTASEAFIWQLDYWFVEDLLRAVRLANTTEDGLLTEVPRSPVKRIVAIRLDKIELPAEEAGASSGDPGMDPGMPMGGMGRPGGRAPARAPAFAAAPTADAGDASHTGRRPGDKNGVYSIRRATLTVVAASDELTRVLDAISRTNFMTTIGVKLSDVDRWADLEAGYAYGPDHVVRAEIEVESAWLHFWLADVATDRLAAAWGIERPAAEEPAAP